MIDFDEIGGESVAVVLVVSSEMMVDSGISAGSAHKDEGVGAGAAHMEEVAVILLRVGVVAGGCMECCDQKSSP